MTEQKRMRREPRPSECPKCGSDRVAREKIMGNDTGDWICGACGEDWPIKYVEDTYDDGQ